MLRPEVIDRALALIGKRPSNYEYFFDELDSAEWIQPLLEHGMFQHPPTPKREGEFISFPFWPESRYLARMASKSPDQVLEIILNTPQTENVRVHVDFVDAACNMPPELAAKWAIKEVSWIESQQYLYSQLPEKIGSLIIYLGKNNQIVIALNLARALLDVLPDRNAKNDSGKEGEYKLPPEPGVRFDIWNYEQILETIFPVLIKVSCSEAFLLLCDLLGAFIRYSGAHEDNGNQEDYSFIWRPAIEDHSQNLDNTLGDMLVSAVRDNAEQIGLVDNDLLTLLIQILESKRWKVFSRIALHILRMYTDRVPILVANHLTNQSLFSDDSLWHEYALLLKKCFRIIQPNQQEIILSWINMGPGLEDSIELNEKSNVNKSSACKLEKYKIWKRDRLAIIKADLSQEWKVRYESLIREFGEPAHPEFISYSESWIGPTSPKRPEDLKSMSIDSIIQFLNSWSPPQEFRAPTPEGLGRALSVVIAEEPRHFAQDAAKFRGLDPTYVRALISGLEEAIKKGYCFEWLPILNLCQWVIDQPIRISGRVIHHRDADLDWEWTRKAIARLLQRGFEESKGKTPFSLRSISWSLLSILNKDPDPTPADEATYGGSNMSPAQLSINTTRGVTMHSLIQYALWVRQYTIEAHGEDYFNRSGFNEMPEVQEVLEHHLNPDNDPSLAVRSVYGRWFPWLVLLDREWSAKNAAKIFPSATDKISNNLRSAAWETYLTFCDVYDDAFDILKNEYFDAVERISPSIDGRDRYLIDSDKRLVNHIMNLYWLGKLNLDDPQSLISRFYAKAPDTLRKNSIELIGRWLYNAKDEIDDDILKRMQSLWIKRINDLETMKKEESRPLEPIAFGWWFISEKFNDIWVTEQLKNAIVIAGRIEPDHYVLEHLSEITDKMILQPIECLDLLLRNDDELRSINLSRSKEARNILEMAINSSDAKAKRIATDLIHFLGARGYFGYRDLISNE